MLSLWKKRSLVLGYGQHRLNLANPQSSCSPFIRDFYQQVIRPKQPYSRFEAIEGYRINLLSSEESISVQPIGAPSTVDSSNTRTLKSIARHSLSKPKFGRFLHRLVQFQRPQYVVELGTSLGITTLYLSLAETRQTIYTLEGCPETARVATRTFSDFHRENIELHEGNIDHTLPNLLDELPKVDLAYVDANHRFEPTLRYFSQLLAKTNEESILVFDDIHWSFDMRKAWKTIIEHPQVTLSVDLFDAGIVFFRPVTVKQHYYLMF